MATGKGFTKWWAEDVSGEPPGRVTLGFFNRSTIYVLSPKAVTPATRAVWLCESGHEWEGTELRFELTPTPKGVMLHFLQAGWRDATEYFRMCNTTWGELMYRLKNDAEGHGAGPLFRRDALAY